MKKSMLYMCTAGLLLGTSLEAFSLFSIDTTQRVENNNHMIKKYEKAIEKLKAENKYILEEKKKNPQLYEKKKLFEDLDDRYVYRVKLNGSKAEALNFMVKDSVVSLSMNMKREEKNDNGYFYSSQNFSSSYKIPSDVVQEKIEHKVEGDYFTIVMPKKKM
ncbi:Hsp20 family protein [Sulfurimonas aquatica]|uniref:Hsp20 family protein n=1 Tax=Sulfurimonas aquatica TaxID=2672570 RepID=A0A975GD28_9BACT|nr:Hsp20/alpha crystallin family protein [Sulfurimonas aquatica]QSZ42142.1 Hsp20 family protein [Sulfurimonas aquatica]